MSIRNEMIEEVKKIWGNIQPHYQYTPLNDVRFGYSFGCLFSMTDLNDQKTIVFGIENMSSNTYKVVTLTCASNVDLVEHLCKVVIRLFPELTFEGYREMTFDILDEIVVPVLTNYEEGFPPGFKILDAGSKIVSDEVDITSISYSISYTDVKFNYKMVSIIEEILQNESK